MKDTFKKFGKEAINVAKSEVSNGAESVKSEVATTTDQVTQSKSQEFGSNLVKKALGTADLLVFKDPREVKTIISSFLLEGEQVYFYLSSTVEEIAVTNLGLIYTNKAMMSSEKTTIKREEYRHNSITNLRIETAGLFDRDAELKFKFGDDKISWDISKNDTNKLFTLYKSLNKVSNLQRETVLATTSIEQSLTVAGTSVQHTNTTDLEQTFKNIYQFAKQQIETTHKIDFSEAF